jgi:flagellar protein FliO/FliZ
MSLKPFLFAVATACSSLAVTTESAFADAGEKTPLNLKDVPSTHAPATGGGSIVRTIVGLAVVIGVIYGIYWILKQVKSSREEKASGQGLAAISTLPLGPNRSLQLVRAGRDLVLLGVTEHGVTPVRSYSEDEAEAAGLLDLEADENGSNGNGNSRPHGSSGGGVLASVMDELRRRTVRR